MTQINPNLNLQQQNVNYGASGNQPDIRQTINKNTVVKSSSGNNDEIRKLILTPFLGTGIYYGMAKFNKACQGNYPGTVLAKAGNLGDKISKWKIIDNKFVHNLAAKTDEYKGKFFEKVVPKNKILNAFFNNPTKPQVQMVVLQSNGSLAEVTKHVADKLWETTNKGQDLNKLHELGFKDADELERITKNAHKKENINKIIEVLGKKRDSDILEAKEHGGKIPFTKKYLTEMFPNATWLKNLLCPKISYSEYANKLKALNGMSEAKSRLGRALPKALYKGIEGLTQSSSGGIFAALLGGFFLADAVNNTIKAKGLNEKRKTLPENLIYLIGWYVTMPISIKLMHNVGGLKYIGTKNVEKFRAALEKFNARACGQKVEGNKFVKLSAEEMKKFGGEFVDKAEYKTELKNLKHILYEDAKWYHKPLIWAGNLMSTGLEQIRPYTGKDATPVLKELKQGKFWLKQGAGYPIRFLTFAMVTSPFFAKIGAKLSQVVFGKPKVSVLDEGKDEKKAEQKKGPQYIGQPMGSPEEAKAQEALLKGANQQKPQGPVSGHVQSGATSAPQQAQPQGQQVAQQPQAATPANAEKPADSQPVAPKRTYSYIPTSTPVKLDKDPSSQKSKDDEKLNKAINKFDKAANVAEQFTK